MVDKVVRDGKVAVVVSPGSGAGWSTWATNLGSEAAVFAPDVVAWIEAGKPNDPEVIEGFEEKYGYAGLMTRRLSGCQSGRSSSSTNTTAPRA